MYATALLFLFQHYKIMACTKCNTSNNTCGCKDTPVQVPFVPQCPPDPLFPDPNPCSQTILDTCVKHRSLYNIHNILNQQGTVITPQTTLEQVYQMLSLQNFNQNCPCPTDFHLSYLGTTAVVFNWTNTISSGNTYTITISTDPNFIVDVSTIPFITNNSITVQNLTAGETYYAYISTSCSIETSDGAVISFTMNS